MTYNFRRYPNIFPPRDKPGNYAIHFDQGDGTELVEIWRWNGWWWLRIGVHPQV
jgi:hypothetical protein